MTTSLARPEHGAQEVELKYAAEDPAAVRAWLDGQLPPGIAAGPWSARSDEDAYVDTEDHAIQAAGYGARLRRRGSRMTLTLKSLVSVGSTDEDGSDGESASPALHRRIEIEGPAARTLDPAGWPESEARGLLESITRGAPLRIRFVVQQHRAVRELKADDGAIAEASLDEVRVRSRDKVVGRFSMLEVEALHGSTAILRQLAAALESNGLLQPEVRTKEAIAAELVESWGRRAAEEGAGVAPDGDASELEGTAAAELEGTAAATDAWATALPGEPPADGERPAERELLAEGKLLVEGELLGEVERPAEGGLTERVPDGAADRQVAPRPPRTAGVRSDDTLGAAGRKVLRMHLARMLAAEEGTRSGAVAEDLHKMRVATRRMRAAWRVFDGAYRTKLQNRYVGELRGVAAALGEVRDLDVQLEGLAAHQATLSPAGADAIGPLVDDWRRRRESARVRLLKLLDSKAYTEFVEDYQEFVDHVREGEVDPAPGEPIFVRDTAGGRVWVAYEKVRARDTTLAWADAPALHALRIDAKRLRYTLEFFIEVLPPGAAGLVASVTELQDVLGALNDADVAARVTRAFLVGGAARLSAASREAIGHYLESREAETIRLRRLLPPVWKRVSGSGFRRGLGLAIAAL